MAQLRRERADIMILSHRCDLLDLVANDPGAISWNDLGWTLSSAWSREWTTSWQVNGTEVICPVRDMGSFDVHRGEPVRRFTWRKGQKHRPGLAFMVSTGQQPGFESLEEAKLLLVLDFLGEIVALLCQPFWLRFSTPDGVRKHAPDVLVATTSGTWLIDVRPRDRIDTEDRVKFAAAAEAALACGWRYLVVAGWQRQVMVTLDTISSQRRPLTDPLGLRPLIVDRLRSGPCSFGTLVAGTVAPAVARAQLLHLVWSRQVGVDLARPLTDDSIVYPAEVNAQ
ncbi:TnsA-like heteromeric transposase endonuclease subunit [Streptosporangium sp. NPDC006930]|uniref:TnsA-like heteromeric transposase endonuclease subunit n=1 Tax=unclassified Streptosporangium TaxID=2632669 RepID=UPI00342604A5